MGEDEEQCDFCGSTDDVEQMEDGSLMCPDCFEEGLS